MKAPSFTLFGLLAASVSAIELTPENYDHMTAGRTVFIKFFAPWCPHSQKLAPDWEALEKELANSDTVLLGEVDCTGDSKPLCDANDVKGFPTLLYGNPAHLETYSGKRDLDTLKKFANSSLKPQCSPTNLSLCNKAEKAEIKKMEALSDAQIAEKVQEMEDAMEKTEVEFKAYTDNLQKEYQEAMRKKDADIQAIYDGGLDLMNSVKIAKQKA